MKFEIETLPEKDQWSIKKGWCPWCLAPLFDGTLCGYEGDVCRECRDEFVGKLSIED